MAAINTRSSLDTLLDVQSLGAELRIYGEVSDPSMRHFNPSIAWYGDKLKIAVRSCNFKVERNGKWSFRDGSAYSKTDVLYGNVHPDSLQVSNLRKLEFSDNTPMRTKVSGLEDVRILQRYDHMFAIGYESDRLTSHLHNKSSSLAEYRIEGNKLEYICTLQKPNEELVEKNWSPIEDSDNYYYSPTQVWTYTGLLGEPYKGILHGGTQLLKQDDGTYLSIIHDKVLSPLLNRPGVYDKYVYRHFLARHDRNGFVIEMTQPLTFGTHENIEFAAGLVEYGSDFIISIGIRDCKYALVKINKSKLTDMLVPISF